MTNYFLKKSLENNLVITIVYQKNGRITQRNIKVLGIDGSRVRAFCYLRGQIREFKVDNILAAGFLKPTARRSIS
ncbi:MAG: hypothetical protein QHH06_02830 [Clostridiales bacterium]|nr:hypothetical protein [Eubacteriales bacterium]MDH7565404.1 hypothetical protein [Clostridiales bacterium]